MMKFFAFTFALLVACGDNVDPPRFDAGEDVDSNQAAAPRAVVVAGDFQATGVLSELDIAHRTASNNIAPTTAVGADPILRKHGDELFVINRIENNVTILDANDYGLVGAPLSTGAGSNPQDVAIDGDKVFIATYARKGLVEMTRGSEAITDIDLSADDPDGKPNCASVYKVGNRLFVTCQLLDDANFFANRGLNGKVYVVDIATRTIQHELDLTTSNPFSLLEQLPEGSMHGGDLVVGTVDFRFGNNNAGCVERITTDTTPTAAGCMIDNTSFSGGFASRLEIAAPTGLGPAAHVIPAATLFMLIPRSDFSGGDVRTVDLTNESLVPGTYNTEGQALGDVAVCEDGIVVVTESPPFNAPANAPQGLRVYTSTKNEATNLAVRIGLKPTSSRGLVCY